MTKPSLPLLGCLLAFAACRHESPAPTSPPTSPPTAPPTSPPTSTPAKSVVKASFTMPDSVNATVAVAFQNLSQNAATYRWSFGDGTADLTAAPTHTYAKGGTYVVTLRAYDAQRQDSAVDVRLITVRPVPPYNIFAHTSTKILGTYDCKVYRAVSCFGVMPSSCQSSFKRQRDTVLVVRATGPESLKINTIDGRYAPNEGTVVDPHGPNYQFLLTLDERSMAHFYTTGDSLLLTQWSHVGHLYTTTYYYRGRRRP